MSAEDLLFHMAETACVRAWEDEGWGPLHKRLLTMCVKIEKPGRRKIEVTNTKTIVRHLTIAGSISARDAMDDYQISGGTLTKVISDLRRVGYDIRSYWYKHPINGRRYKRYFFEATAGAELRRRSHG